MLVELTTYSRRSYCSANPVHLPLGKTIQSILARLEYDVVQRPQAANQRLILSSPRKVDLRYMHLHQEINN